MPAFNEVKESLLATVEAAMAILEVGEASSETIDVVIVLLESTIGVLRDTRGKPRQQVLAPGKTVPDRAAGDSTRVVSTPAAPAPSSQSVEKVAIKKTELLEMGVSLSTIREWLDEGKLRKTGRFALYYYDRDVRKLVESNLAEKRGRAGIKTAGAAGAGYESISRSELIRRGVAKSTIGYWCKTGKLRKTAVQGEYMFIGSVVDLLASYRRRSRGVELTEEEARSEGRISRKALIQKGVKEGTIGYWVNAGKLRKAGEQGYYLYDESTRRLLENYRSTRRK